MNLQTGNTHAPTALQAYLADLAQLARTIPTATVQRSIALPEIGAARVLAVPRPSWLAVFTKALAFVAQTQPVLRQVYLSLPRPRLYQHPHPVAAVAVRRPLDEDVTMLWGRVRNPADFGLEQLDAKLKCFKEEPVEDVGQVRRVQSRGRWPWPIRRLAWGREALMSGSRRARRLGTFAVASLGALGAEIIDPLYPVATTMSYGVIESGGVELRLKYDARVLTPFVAAEILQDVERVLRCEIVMELRYFQRLQAA